MLQTRHQPLKRKTFQQLYHRLDPTKGPAHVAAQRAGPPKGGEQKGRTPTGSSLRLSGSDRAQEGLAKPFSPTLRLRPSMYQCLLLLSDCKEELNCSTLQLLPMASQCVRDTVVAALLERGPPGKALERGQDSVLRSHQNHLCGHQVLGGEAVPGSSHRSWP